MNVLFDSDVLIEISRGRDAALVERWTELSGSERTIFFSPITSAELWAGARPQEQSIIAGLFKSLRCATIDETTARLAGDFLHRYAASHHLKIADALIAASAVQYRAALWTRNRMHFPMQEVEFY